MAKRVELTGNFGTVSISSTGQTARVWGETVPILVVEGTQLDKGYPTPWWAQFTVAGGVVRLSPREEDRSGHFACYPEYRGKLTRALQAALRT